LDGIDGRIHGVVRRTVRQSQYEKRDVIRIHDPVGVQVTGLGNCVGTDVEIILVAVIKTICNPPFQICYTTVKSTL
jgi:hypothetical protein